MFCFTTIDYLCNLYDLAKLIENYSGVPAEIVASQSILESFWGTSSNAVAANNL